ncbi:MAG TPA: YggT family protein [Burkholderiales bacterium]|jgi:YggT family protein|nr:YggT family protein [Burkholderiales bacterium]
MNQVLIFLLETFLGLFSLALLMRFYLQTVRAPARNPLSQFLAALTDFIVRPTRRVVPGLWGYDLSTLLLAWVTELVLVSSVLALKGYQVGPGVGSAVVGLMLLSTLNLLKLFIYILMVAVFAQAILSFVAPRGPATSVLASLTRPFLSVFQRRVAPVGGVDLSPLFVLVICQILLMWPVSALEQAITRML